MPGGLGRAPRPGARAGGSIERARMPVAELLPIVESSDSPGRAPPSAAQARVRSRHWSHCPDVGTVVAVFDARVQRVALPTSGQMLPALDLRSIGCSGRGATCAFRPPIAAISAALVHAEGGVRPAVAVPAPLRAAEPRSTPHFSPSAPLSLNRPETARPRPVLLHRLDDREPAASAALSCRHFAELRAHVR
jgi:hypothetical protein